MINLHRILLASMMMVSCTINLSAQEQSVRPGINDPFRSPAVDEFVGKFEVESREVYAHRKEIVKACQIKPGQTVADIGAGTGLFTRLFAEAVGNQGQVIAVDIAQKFLDHITLTAREAGFKNIKTLQSKPDSSELPAESVDLIFICDTYHHFEFPQKTMVSLQRALKPGGRLILIDFHRVVGKSTDWVMSHVRAGQEVFEREITDAGLRKVNEEKELLKENYFVIFEKPTTKTNQQSADHAPEPGQGKGHGPGPEMRADQAVFHYLLENHSKIHRTVKLLDNGVDTLTESDDPAVAAKIQEHVVAMHERVKKGRGLRFWDELFVAIFKDYDKITMLVENTEKGVRVKETSDNKQVVSLIQAHAEVVSLFVKHGFDEAHKNHPVPKPQQGTSKQIFPLIKNYGGITPRPQATEQPKAGAKVVLDVTSDAKPTEINKGLERAARLINLYGAAGMKATDVKLTIVLHGEAIKSAIKDVHYKQRFEQPTNPNLPLIAELKSAGVEVLICGQALSNKGYNDNELAAEVTIAASAITALANKQAAGYSYVPVP
jgi:ubiquinone/menaquinone biosynthesis C-methylase UbiE/intracellular sulfur oxidation DsrE/DsrF family protein